MLLVSLSPSSLRRSTAFFQSPRHQPLGLVTISWRTKRFRLRGAPRREYNETRPHSSLGNRAPARYIAELLGIAVVQRSR